MNQIAEKLKVFILKINQDVWVKVFSGLILGAITISLIYFKNLFFNEFSFERFICLISNEISIKPYLLVFILVSFLILFFLLSKYLNKLNTLDPLCYNKDILFKTTQFDLDNIKWKFQVEFNEYNRPVLKGLHPYCSLHLSATKMQFNKDYSEYVCMNKGCTASINKYPHGIDDYSRYSNQITSHIEEEWAKICNMKKPFFYIETIMMNNFFAVVCLTALLGIAIFLVSNQPEDKTSVTNKFLIHVNSNRVDTANTSIVHFDSMPIQSKIIKQHIVEHNSPVKKDLTISQIYYRKEIDLSEGEVFVDTLTGISISVYDITKECKAKAFYNIPNYRSGLYGTDPIGTVVYAGKSWVYNVNDKNYNLTLSINPTYKTWGVTLVEIRKK